MSHEEMSRADQVKASQEFTGDAPTKDSIDALAADFNAAHSRAGEVAATAGDTLTDGETPTEERINSLIDDFNAGHKE